MRSCAGRAVTNTPPHGAFRGFGAPQTEFAAETHLDRVAEALGMSPLEIRRRNAYREGDTTATGQVLRESVAALDVLEAAAEASGFERIWEGHDHGARPDEEARAASGIGIALGWHGAGFTGSGEARLASVASVELTAGGEILALAANTEMGQGSRTVLAPGGRRGARDRAGPGGRRAPRHLARPGHRADRGIAHHDAGRRAARDGRGTPPE